MHRIISVPRWICSFYLKELQYAMLDKLPSKELGLPDGDCSNKVYRSKRSNFEYVYLVSPLTQAMSWCLIKYLRIKTGINFSGSINDRRAPINTYGTGESIKVHRDRNMVTGEYVHYIATFLLHQAKGGAFYYNKGKQEVSNFGKTVERNPNLDKFFDLKQGQIIILDNSTTVHGVSDVEAGIRISLTFRSK
jgi:hypothetical protein